MAWGGSRKGSGRKPKNRGALPDLDIHLALTEPGSEAIERAAQRCFMTALTSLRKNLGPGNKIPFVATANTMCISSKHQRRRGPPKPSMIIRGVIGRICPP